MISLLTLLFVSSAEGGGMEIKMRNAKAVMFICLSLAILCSCGKKELAPEKDYVEKTAEPDENEKNSGQDDSKEGEDAVQYGGKDKAELGQDRDDGGNTYKDAYLSYLDSLGDAADTCTYSLIYVDEDDIPELVIDTGYEAGGCQILTFHDGILDEWQSNRLNVTYIEKGNLICNSDGNMGYYHDYVYTIQDGKWRYVDGGVWGDPSDGPQFDENGDYIFVYQWGEEEVSEEEYGTRLNEVYPSKQARQAEKYYILKEIRSVLETGDATFAGHRYEMVVEDLTWKEAEALCREKGGYLATITTWEELERIQEQMISEDKENITFFVGANNERTDNTFGFHWIEPESGETYDMLNLYNALFEFWLEGEPSYTGLTEDGVEVDEDYVVLFYRKADDRCYLNDVPDDILSAAPSYAGKVGYICEYEK